MNEDQTSASVRLLPSMESSLSSSEPEPLVVAREPGNSRIYGKSAEMLVLDEYPMAQAALGSTRELATAPLLREPIAQVTPSALANKGVDFAVQDASLRPSIGELMRRQPLNAETRLEFAVLPRTNV